MCGEIADLMVPKAKEIHHGSNDSINPCLITLLCTPHLLQTKNKFKRAIKFTCSNAMVFFRQTISKEI